MRGFLNIIIVSVHDLFQYFFSIFGGGDTLNLNSFLLFTPFFFHH